MEGEHLERIELRLDRLETGVEELKTDVRELKADVRVLKADVQVLKVDVGQLKTGQDDLRRQMLVLHEEVIATIKAIPDPIPRCERMIKAGIAELREEIGRRLDPLEAIVRRHFAG